MKKFKRLSRYLFLFTIIRYFEKDSCFFLILCVYFSCFVLLALVIFFFFALLYFKRWPWFMVSSSITKLHIALLPPHAIALCYWNNFCRFHFMMIMMMTGQVKAQNMRPISRFVHINSNTHTHQILDGECLVATHTHTRTVSTANSKGSNAITLRARFHHVIFQHSEKKMYAANVNEFLNDFPETIFHLMNS